MANEIKIRNAEIPGERIYYIKLPQVVTLGVFKYRQPLLCADGKVRMCELPDDFKSGRIIPVSTA